MDELGKAYVRLTLAWDYNRCRVTVLMPRYVQEALHTFQHAKPKRLQFSPHLYDKPKFGQKQQDTQPPPPTSKEITPKDKKRIKQIIRKFLFYGQGVDSTMLMVIM